MINPWFELNLQSSVANIPHNLHGVKEIPWRTNDQQFLINFNEQFY